MPCIGNVPSIVASGLISHTGASMSAVTIFTPLTTGTYRVSLYVSPEPNASYPAGSPTVDITLTWTDSNSARTLVLGKSHLDGGSSIADPGFTAGDLIIQSTASDIQVSFANGASVVTYDIYYVVEQLA